MLCAVARACACPPLAAGRALGLGGEVRGDWRGWAAFPQLVLIQDELFISRMHVRLPESKECIEPCRSIKAPIACLWTRSWREALRRSAWSAP